MVERDNSEAGRRVDEILDRLPKAFGNLQQSPAASINHSTVEARKTALDEALGRTPTGSATERAKTRESNNRGGPG
jgi:hypothetical protein